MLFLGSRVTIRLPKPETRGRLLADGPRRLSTVTTRGGSCSLFLFHIAHNLPLPSRSPTLWSSGPYSCKRLLLVTPRCNLVPTELSPPAPRAERLCAQEGCQCWISVILNVSKFILWPRTRLFRSVYQVLLKRMSVLLCLGPVRSVHSNDALLVDRVVQVTSIPYLLFTRYISYRSAY